MTEPTTDTPAPTPETETPAETAARKGRGPTRDFTKFADLLQSLEAEPEAFRRMAIDSIAAGDSAAEIRADVAEQQRELEEHIEAERAEIALNLRVATYVERAERLPRILRRAVAPVFEAADEEPESPPVAGPEVPEGEGT